MAFQKPVHTWLLSSAEESATIILGRLQQQTVHHCKQYNINPGYLLQCHHHLFQKPLQDKRKLPYDHLSCWLGSVEEAHSILLTQEAHLWSTAHTFFSIITSTRGPGTSSDSQDSSYNPSRSYDDPSLSTTTSLTQTLTNSLSSNNSLSGSTTYFSSDISYITFFPDNDSALSHDALEFDNHTDNLDNYITPPDNNNSFQCNQISSSLRQQQMQQRHIRQITLC